MNGYAETGSFELHYHPSGSGFVLDAVVDGHVPVGKASGYEHDGAQRHDIFVSEKWRGLGIGTALAAAARAISESGFGWFHWGELGMTADGERLAERIDGMWRDGVPGWVDDMVSGLLSVGRASLPPAKPLPCKDASFRQLPARTEGCEPLMRCRQGTGSFQDIHPSPPPS